MDKGVVAFGFAAADLEQVEHSVRAAGGRLLAAGPDTVRIADATIFDLSNDPLPFDPVDVTGRVVIRTRLHDLDDTIDAWPDADIVVGADPVDLHLAIAEAIKRPEGIAPRTWDVTSNEGLRLQRLADEIARIARTLVDLPEDHGKAARIRTELITEEKPAGDAPLSSTPVTAGEVRAIIRLRRMRDRYFAPDLFADPAWDMLLDLAAARIERVRVAVSSLCIAAAVPPTTALRWIKAMTDKGLLRRVADPHDARRVFIQLSDDAAKAMEAYLRAARGGGAAI